MQKEFKKKKEKTQKYNNPFDDIFFWLSIAAADFSFGMVENNAELKPKPERCISEKR